MQRLPTAVRSSLLAEASPSAQSAVRRWSLRSLVALNAGGAAAVDWKAPRALGRTPNKGCARSSAAELLLRDVRIRLAGQHRRTARLLEQARDLLDDPLPFGSSDNKVVVTGVRNAARGGGDGKVIKALNNPVRMDMKRWSRDLKDSNFIQDESIRLLENLEAMHVDTYHLVHQLLPPQEGGGGGETVRPEFLNRWSAADRAMVEAVFEQIRSRHASSVETLADVVIGLRRCRSLRNGDGHVLQPGYFCGIDLALIDAFLRERLGVQLLCDHYVALDKGKPSGGISVDCDLWDVLDDAVTEAKHMCDANLGVAPEVCMGVGLEGCPAFSEQECILGEPVDFSTDISEITISLIRPWMHHALVEVLKNAMGSTVKKALRDCPSAVLHPGNVHVRIVNTEHYLSVLVLDEGTGLDKDSTVRAFRFGDSTSPRRWDRIDEQQSYAMVRAPLGSLGVGLPLSRMMMQLFGGDLTLSNRFKEQTRKSDNGPRASGCVVALRLLKNDCFIEGDVLPDFSLINNGQSLEHA